MNEKEIEGILFDAAIEMRSLMPSIEYRRLAAHAIAEKIAEGVVHRVSLPRSYDDISETVNFKTGWEQREDIEIHVEVFGKAQGRFGGVESITVTVTKEE